MQFGDTPQLMALDFFLDNYNFDYPLTEIARESNVSYNSLKSFFSYFIKLGIVVWTRKVGKSDYYKLNIKNEVVSNLMKLDFTLVKQSIAEPMKKEIIIAP